MSKVDPRQVRHVHMIAICGTGMGSLAGMLKARGLHVTGSDVAVYPPMSEQLAGLGIPIMSGYDAAHLEPRPDLVVVGNAISKGNPEGDAAIARGIPYVSMAEALRLFFFEGKTLLGLCGTHGKTTSTALLSWLLAAAGRDPTYLVGGVMVNTDASYRVGGGALAVVEGDEYDTAWFDKVPKFVRYRPDLAVMANIEFDHADIYADLDAVIAAFRALVEGLPADGLLVAGIDSPPVHDLLAYAPCEVATFALTRPADYRGRVIETQPAGMSVTIEARGRHLGPFATRMVGEHNLLNILGVFALAERVGLTVEEFASGLASFQGVRRRQQALGEPDGVLVIDDFAHHPTAVRVTLAGLRAARDRRLVAVFEPRTNTSRRAFFQQEYAASFDAADEVVVCEVLAQVKALPEDKFDVRRLIADLRERGKDATYAADYEAILAHLREGLRPGDQVVFLSNGGFGNLPRRCVDLLAQREAAR